MKWPPNLAPFDAAFCSLRTHARQGSNSESLPAGLAAPNLVREPVLDSHAPPPISVDFQRPATTSMDHMYTKATTRLRDKMASPSSPSPISFRGTFDPISNPPPWQPCALVTQRARQNHKPNRSRNWSAARPTLSISGAWVPRQH